MSLPDSSLAGADVPTAAGPDRRIAVSRTQSGLAGAAVAFAVAFAWLIRDHQMDDAYIGFQYLKSLLAGHGFVFFPGAPAVEGVTNIGWQLVLAPLALLVGAEAAAKLLGLALVLVALRLVAVIGGTVVDRARPVSGGSLWLVPVLLLASSFDFLYFAFAGMETGLLAVLLLAMAVRAGLRPDCPSLPALGAAAFLTHPEAVLVFPLYAALALAGRLAGRRRLLGALAAMAGLVLAITGLRYGYFGDVVPNTFHAKSGSLFLKIDGGFRFLLARNVNIAFPILGAVVLPILAFGYLRVRRASPATAAMLVAITATGIAFGVYSPPDWTGFGRYFAPYLPGALILFWCGLAEAVDAAGGLAARWKRPALTVTAATLVAAQLYGIVIAMARMDAYPGYVLAGHTLVAPARWIRDTLPADATIATRRIGALAYHSERAVFDYVHGLTERAVAAAIAERGGGFDATDPDLAALWRARAPDYILEDDDVMADIIAAAGGAPERFTVHGIAYGVLRDFPIGADARWVLAGRLELP